jgi:glutamate synthase (NADPH/NADH) large chain
VDAVKSGHNILIVDRSIGPDRVAIPALLATSTIHQHLVSKGLRTSTGLVVETGSARETHHFALLAGYGAEAVHPYLAMETLAEMAPACRATCRRKSHLQLHQGHRQGPDEGHVEDGHLDLYVLLRRADLRSHRPEQVAGRQILPGTASNVEGIGVFEVAEEALRLHHLAFGNDPVLANRWTPAANTPSASAVKTTCGRRTRSPSCSTRPAQQLPATRNTPRSSTTRASAT